MLYLFILRKKKKIQKKIILTQQFFQKKNRLLLRLKKGIIGNLEEISSVELKTPKII